MNTYPSDLFLLLCWLVAVLAALFIGAFFSDVLLPWWCRWRSGEQKHGVSKWMRQAD
jgi:hypothetical protein